MALGGSGVSIGLGDGLSSSDTGLSDGHGGMQGLDYQDGIHSNFAKAIHYRKIPLSAAVVASFTTLFTFTGDALSKYRSQGGTLISSATNTPRIEQDVNGSVLGLLMEEARTNLYIRSQELDNVAWTAIRATIANTALPLAPDGSATADALSEDATAASDHVLNQNPTFVISTLYTLSVWVRAGARNWLITQLGAAAFGSTPTASFNLGAGTVGTITGTATATITSYANGWYRCTMTSTATTSAAAATRFYVGEADNDATFDGLSQVSLYLWGAQIEAGSFASSYIPTTTIAVTRAADNCIRTLGSEFSATAGTVVVAVRSSGGQNAALGQTIIEIDDTTNNERHTLTRAATFDTARYNIFDGGAAQSSMDSASLPNLTAFKCAFAWSLNDIAQSTNGGAVNTDAAATLPTVTQLVLGGPGGNGNSFMNGHILRFDCWPERKRNSVLQALTN